MASSVYFLVSELPRAHLIELRLRADLDIEAFNEITEQLIDRWPVPAGRSVVVDLTQSNYLGSGLLGLIINIRQRTRAGRGELLVCGASQELSRVFRTANLERLIALVATREQALSEL